jgi:hypothetical protein
MRHSQIDAGEGTQVDEQRQHHEGGEENPRRDQQPPAQNWPAESNQC